MAYLYLKVDASNLSVGDMNRVIGNNPQFTVSSTSGVSTTLTVNTGSAHGFSNGDTVVIAGLLASTGAPVTYIEPVTSLVRPVEGLFTIASVLSTSFQITIPAAASAAAVSGAVSKFTAPAAGDMNGLCNLLSGIQAGAIDAVVEVTSSNADRALPPSSQGGAGVAGTVNCYNLK